MKDENSQVAPQIAEIVGLLDTLAPEALEDLRRRFPDQRDLLRKGMVLGIADSNLEARAQAVLTMAGHMRKMAVGLVNRVRGRLRRANALEIASEVLALLGSSAAIGSAVKGWRPGIVGCAAASLLGTIFAIRVRFYRNGLLGRRDSLLRTFELLAEAPAEAEEIGRELEIALHPSTGEAPPLQVEKLIERANALSRKVRRAEAELPEPIRR
jgi:hypothetical protein